MSDPLTCIAVPRNSKLTSTGQGLVGFNNSAPEPPVNVSRYGKLFSTEPRSVSLIGLPSTASPLSSSRSKK